jgi:Ca-activated chloride channel family protein
MAFLSPTMLWSLLAVPVLALAYILLQRRRKKYAVRLGSLLLMKQALKRGPGWQRHIPPLLLLVALITLMIALARPVTFVTLPTREGTVILLMDVSGSMQATDIEPSRLEASKAAARAFVNNQPDGVRIGVVSFSDNASIVQAPTADRNDVLAAINRLRQQRATGIGRGLLTSLDAIFSGDSAEEAAISPYQFQFPQGRQPFGQQQQPPRGFPDRPTPIPSPTMTPVPKGTYVPAIIVLLTDGENNQYPPPLDIIDQVVNRGVRVFTVGLGSNQGVVVTNQGRSMRTRLDEATLKKIAEETDGEYFNASSAQDLRTIYEHLGLELVMRTEKQEITWGFAGIGILLLLMASTLSMFWFNRVL